MLAIALQPQNFVSERGAIAARDSAPALVLPYESGELPRGVPNGYEGPPGRKHAIGLAGHDEPFEVGQQAGQVNIGRPPMLWG